MRIGTVTDLKETLGEVSALLSLALAGGAVVHQRAYDGRGEIFTVTVERSNGRREGWALRREPERVVALGRMILTVARIDLATGVGCDAEGGIVFEPGTSLHRIASRVLGGGQPNRR